jgi:hypothetical protein
MHYGMVAALAKSHTGQAVKRKKGEHHEGFEVTEERTACHRDLRTGTDRLSCSLEGNGKR